MNASGNQNQVEEPNAAEPEAETAVITKSKRKRKPTPASCALTVHPGATMTIRQEKISQMMTLATECGFACEALTTYRQMLATEIASHMVHRRAFAVYQSVGFNIPLFSRQAALEICGEPNMTIQTEHQLQWKLTRVPDCGHLLEPILSSLGCGSLCAGMSRALLAESEVTAMVIATVMPTLQIQWDRMANGVGRLKINYFYVLSDMDGEMHAPKDENRRELELADDLIQDLRVRILMDARAMIDRGYPMASGWYRQLGRHAKADEIEECEIAGTKPAKPVPPPKLKLKKNHFNIECILEERKSTGKAKVWFLVQWEGYNPKWEQWRIYGMVGDPLTTWERLSTVKNTEAYSAWKQRVPLLA